MAMAQAAFKTRPALFRHRAVAANEAKSAEIPLFQAFLRPSSAKVTDGLCIKDTTTIENKLYIQTGKVKPTAKQIAANPKVEICAMVGGEWIRVSGTLVEDDRYEARKSMLDAYPSLRNMYDENDGNTVVYYFKDATAVISAFTHEPETIQF